MTTATCRRCGKAVRWVAQRHAWVHVTRGADHGPVPDRRAEVMPPT